MKTLQERFWEKVPSRPSEGCWLWSASKKPNGYGQINVNRRADFAHRVSFELANGSIGDGLVVRHKCDNRLCVRPDHLEIGTQADNMHDMISRGRARRTGMPGEKNPASKLTDKQRGEILKESEKSLRELAEKYGVSRSLICLIRKAARINEEAEFVETD